LAGQPVQGELFGRRVGIEESLTEVPPGLADAAHPPPVLALRDGPATELLEPAVNDQAVEQAPHGPHVPLLAARARDLARREGIRQDDASLRDVASGLDEYVRGLDVAMGTVTGLAQLAEALDDGADNRGESRGVEPHAAGDELAQRAVVVAGDVVCAALAAPEFLDGRPVLGAGGGHALLELGSLQEELDRGIGLIGRQGVEGTEFLDAVQGRLVGRGIGASGGPQGGQAASEDLAVGLEPAESRHAVGSSSGDEGARH